MRIVILMIALIICQGAIAQDQMFDICPLKVGEEIPAVTLADENEAKVSLLNLISDKPTVIIFYRGAWCGYCIKHLAELNDIKQDIESFGYQVFGITVDQSSKLEESKIKSKSDIPVYSDSNLEAIEGFGLGWKVEEELFEKYKSKYDLDLEKWSGADHHALPVPSIFVIKERVVQFQYVNPNYRTRLKPETLLAVLKTI